MCGRVSRMMLRKSFALWCTIQNQEPGYQLGVTRACAHVRVNDPVRRRVGHKLARERWPVRVYSVALIICVHMPLLMFAASVTVTKAREAKTWADSAPVDHPRSPAGTMRTAVSSRFRMLRDSEAIAQVDDAHLAEFAFSGNVSLTRPVAGVSRRKLP